MPFTGSGVGYKLGITDADVPGWHLPASDGIYPWGLQNVNAFSAGPAADGNQWIVLGQVSAGVDFTIQQTMTGLTLGNTYQLSFEIASEQGCCSVAEVSFLSGSSTGPQDFTAPSSGTDWTAWGTHTENFLATASSVTLQFKDLAIGGTGEDLGLDNVHVTGAVVPEPKSVVLLGSILIGLAVFRGFSLDKMFQRRRRFP
jgi:hypothetical protein